MDISAIEPFLDCGRIHFRFLSFLISIRDAEGGIGEKMGIGRGKTEEEEPLLILLLPLLTPPPPRLPPPPPPPPPAPPAPPAPPPPLPPYLYLVVQYCIG